jgi:hypothetical protein
MQQFGMIADALRYTTEIVMSKILLTALVFVLVSTAVPSYAQQATTKDQLIGSWTPDFHMNPM